MSNAIVSAISRAFKALFGSTPKQQNNNQRTHAAPAAKPPSSTGDIRTCRDPKHGGKAIPRKFLAHGVSESGRAFQVFQCPSCGEFVSLARDLYSDRDYVLFRGRHYTARRNIRPSYTSTARTIPAQGKQPRSMRLKPATCLMPFALGLLFMASGCSKREFKVALSPEEPIPVDAPVLLDGRAVGKISAIHQAGPTRLATLRITDEPALALMRTGLERQPGTPGEIKLSSLRATGTPLEPGSLIPTRSPAKETAINIVNKAQQLSWALRDFLADHPGLGIGAGIAILICAFCLIRRLAVRAACLLIFLCLIAYFATTKAHGQELRQELGYTRQGLLSEQRQYEHALQNAEVQIHTAKERLTSGLAGLAEAPLLSACIRLDVVEAQMSGHQDRVRALRRSAFAYNRDKEIGRLLGTASEQESRRNRLTNEIDSLVTAPTATNWPGLSLYLAKRHDFAALFQAKPATLDDIFRTLETPIPPEPLLRAAIGLPLPQVSPKASASALAAAPAAAVTTQYIFAATATPNPEVLRVESNTLEIARQLGQLRRQQSDLQNDVALVQKSLTNAIAAQPPQARSRELTGTTRQPSSSSTKAHGPLVAPTNQPASNSNMAGSPVALLANRDVGSTNTSGSFAQKAPHLAGQPSDLSSLSTARQSPTAKSTRNTPPATNPALRSLPGLSPALVAFATASLALTIGLALLAYSAWLRGRPFTISLSTNQERTDHFELSAMDEALFLEAPPFSDHVSHTARAPRLVVTWRGPILRAGATPASVNGSPLTGNHRLRPGDRIAISPESGALLQFEFLGCDPVCMQDASETQVT